MIKSTIKFNNMKAEPHIEVLDPQIIEIFRQKTPVEKVAMISDAHRTARLLTRAGIRYLHPNWSEDQIHAELVRRMTGGTS